MVEVRQHPNKYIRAGEVTQKRTRKCSGVSAMCGLSGQGDRRCVSDDRDVGKGLEEEVTAMRASAGRHLTHPIPLLVMPVPLAPILT